MPITFDCACGKTLRVPDVHAGKRVKCPACGSISSVPQAEPMFEVVEDTAAPLVAPPPTRAKPVTRPAADDEDEEDRRGYGVSRSRRDDDDDDDDDDRGRKKSESRRRSRRDDDDDEEEERPRKKKRKKKKHPARNENSGRSLEGSVINGGVAGGLLAMVIAIVWFVLGLINDWIFFYPPILFILGLVAFFKGLAGEE
jgi:hypothetical protein